MEIKITNNFVAALGRFEARIDKRLKDITENALNNQAAQARLDVQAKIKEIFRNPEDVTVNSVKFRKVGPNLPINSMQATVYIADDLPKGSVQPAKYLLTEETGGVRGNKRGENVLVSAGILPRGVQMTPAPGTPLDAHEQPTGAGMVQMLSRLRAFHEIGFRANATDATRKKLIRAAKSAAGKAAREAGGSAADVRAARAGAFLPIVKNTGNEFFAGKSKLTDGFMGVFKLVGRGNIVPVAWFDTKRPTYKPRFPFKQIVSDSARASFKASWERARSYVAKK